MQVTMTIYRRGVNWKRMPKTCKFVAWTTGGHRRVVWYARRDTYEVPYNYDLSWRSKDIVAWCHLPVLEAKP